MDYKEKYEMALEGIQEILSSGEDSIKMSRLQLRLQGIFPELKESEDERIRKEMIDFFQETIENVGYSPNIFTMNNAKKWIAWLEKQGNRVVDEELSKLLNKVICRFINDPNIPYSERDEVSKKIVPYVEHLEKQGEQKSMPQEYADAFDEFMSHIPEKEPEFSENCYNYDDMVSAIQFGIKWQQQHDSIVKVKPKYEPKFRVGDVIRPKGSTAEYTIESISGECYHGKGWGLHIGCEEDYELVEQKPAWSKEDESRMDNLCHFLEEYGNQYYGHLTLQGTIAWLKSLRPQPKQEWSEEDETYSDHVITAIKSYYTDDKGKENPWREELLRWLKSLKERVQPQPKQEWSEKDKNMLQSILDEYKSMPIEKRNWLKSLNDRVQLQPI